MKKELILNYAILLIINALAVFTLKLFTNPIEAGAFIFLLFAIKFLIVAFYFMELKKAHLFWKFSLLVFLFFLVVLIIIMK